MSTTTENGTSTEATSASSATASTAKTLTRRAPEALPASTDHATELLIKRPTSEITRLVFIALLGCAACIALVGVVSEANSSATSPDAPAPEVIVDIAD